MFRFITFTTLLILALAGCASAPAAAPKQAGVLQWGVVGESDVPTLDPALASDPLSLSLTSMIYGGLVRLDQQLRVQPDGAARWTISPDGRTYTFYLRSNLGCPDGRRITAPDFVASLQRALSLDGSTTPYYLSLIATQHHRRAIAAVGRHVVRITLTHPAGQFLAELAFPASDVPDPALFRRYGSTWTDHAAGFGPFYVTTWRHNRYVTLAPNPHYYGHRPSLRRIVVRFYPQSSIALSAYRQGHLDLVSGFPAGSSAGADPAGLTRVPGLALDYLAFNTTRLPFHHLNARRAFASLVSTRLDARAMGSTAFPARHCLASGFALSCPLWHGTKPASAYLRAAGYPDGRGFPPVSLVIPRDPQLKALALSLARRWSAALHITAHVQPLNLSNYAAVLNSRTFGLAIVRWGADYPDAQDFLGTQLGASGDNVTGWSSRRYERLIQQAQAAPPTDSQRTTLLRQAALLETAKVVLIPLDEPALTLITRPGLRGIALTPLGTLCGRWARVRLPS